MSTWSWQKWIGKLSPIIVTLLTTGVWEFIETPAPMWAPIVAGIITFLVQQVISLFPPKEV
jgi:hypothetical protein